MPRIYFTAHLRKLAPMGPIEVEGVTISAALDRVFARHPAVKGYILDDQNRLRKHIAIFVEGDRIGDTAGLQRAVGPRSEIHVMQALSGG